MTAMIMMPTFTSGNAEVCGAAGHDEDCDSATVASPCLDTEGDKDHDGYVDMKCYSTDAGGHRHYAHD